METRLMYQLIRIECLGFKYTWISCRERSWYMSLPHFSIPQPTGSGTLITGKS